MDARDQNPAKRLMGRSASFLSGIAELAVALMMVHIVANILLFAFFLLALAGFSRLVKVLITLAYGPPTNGPATSGAARG